LGHLSILRGVRYLQARLWLHRNSVTGSAALEALLEVIGVLMPTGKKTAQERVHRDAYIYDVFDGSWSKDMDGDKSLVKLVEQSGRDWATTSDQIIGTLASLDRRL
jgi:hypothetical protein